MASYLVSITVFVAMAMVVYSTPIDKDKPALSCLENEEYHKCSVVHCYKTCEHLIKPPACPSVTPDCYDPACDCKNDYLRNKEGVCIPTKTCETWNPKIHS